jgi:hypothetical protein
MASLVPHSTGFVDPDPGPEVRDPAAWLEPLSRDPGTEMGKRPAAGSEMLYRQPGSYVLFWFYLF